MATLHHPPSAKQLKAQPPEPVFYFLRAGQPVLRIYNPASFNAGPTTFRFYGPLLRFDHQPGDGRGTKRKPGPDPTRGVLYAAPSLSCCLAEVFGDSRLIVPGDYEVGFLELSRDLKLLDLVDHAMAAGTIAALSATKHPLAQEWSRHFYEADVFQDVDGIFYRAAHTGEEAFAFYERASDALHCPPGNTLRLDDPGLRDEILLIAKRHGMIFDLNP